MSSRGCLFILSAPSGSGKTSLANRILNDIPQLTFSVSYTTRKPRKGERNGVDYFFVDELEFEAMIRRRAFLEHAFVYGHYYGTSRSYVESQLEQGNDVLLDIDVQGAMKVKSKVETAVMVFVLPPSFEVLEKRLRTRGLDDPEVIEARLKIARDEIRRFRRYDYFIVNRVIEESVNELKSIVLASRCAANRRMEIAEEIVSTFKV
jgi:guanylate kinase